MSVSPANAPAVSKFLDANPVLRYLVEDNPEHMARAKALVESDRLLRSSVLTLAEVANVLTRVYRLARVDVVDALIALLNRENVHLHEIETDLAIKALSLCRPSGRVNFADALLWSVAQSAAPARVWSFDERFPVDGIEVQRP